MKKGLSFQKTKVVIFLALLGAVLPLATLAQTLQFNGMSIDQELLRLRNETQMTALGDPVSANAGDRVKFLIYYHCGWNSSAWPTEKARQVKARIDFPTTAQSIIQSLAILSAANVPQITNNGTINATSSQTLSFVNFARWFRQNNSVSSDLPVNMGNGYIETTLPEDIACDPNNFPNNAGYVIFWANLSNIQTPLPTVDLKANGSDGPITITYNTSANLSWTSTNATACQAIGAWSGGKAISSSGESTGNLTSSQTYSIYCTGPGGTSNTDSVIVNVQPQATQNITVSKTARNLSDNTNFGEQVTADPGEVIEFGIVVSNTGNTTADNLIVKDVLPANMSYYGGLTIDGVPNLGGNIANGVSLGNLAPGQNKTIVFQAVLSPATSFGFGVTNLTNSALAYNAAVSKSDTAIVQVIRTEVRGATDVPTGAFDDPWFALSLGSAALLTYLFLLKFYFSRNKFVLGLTWHKKDSSDERLTKLVSEIRKKESIT
jgi:uncharacterized repeat protein (TIGR01451 family)